MGEPSEMGYSMSQYHVHSNNKECLHEWHLSKVQRYSNNPHQGYSEWACEKCGAIKEIKFNDVYVLEDES